MLGRISGLGQIQLPQRKVKTARLSAKLRLNARAPRLSTVTASLGGLADQTGEGVDEARLHLENSFRVPTSMAQFGSSGGGALMEVRVGGV